VRRMALGAALPAVALATAGASTARSLGTLSLHATFIGTPVQEVGCPAGTPDTTSCVAAAGKGLVPGLGRVMETFTEMIVSSSATCSHTTFAPAAITVAGKSEIDATITDAYQCDPPNEQSATDSFTITGGSGAYSGASGSGQLEFTAFHPTGATSATETHRWSGTVSVPTLDFDTAAPTIVGARNLLVRTKGPTLGCASTSPRTTRSTERSPPPARRAAVPCSASDAPASPARRPTRAQTQGRPASRSRSSTYAAEHGPAEAVRAARASALRSRRRARLSRKS
jgi:hypothetical protein